MADRSVMVVDDDASVRETIAMVLELGGLRAITVADGAACMEELRKGFKGLILLDIMMPGMDGWTVVKTMTEQGLAEGNGVCMVSALAPDPNPVSRSPVIRGYIRKPFDIQALLTAVNELLSAL